MQSFSGNSIGRRGGSSRSPTRRMRRSSFRPLTLSSPNKLVIMWVPVFVILAMILLNFHVIQRQEEGKFQIIHLRVPDAPIAMNKTKREPPPPKKRTYAIAHNGGRSYEGWKEYAVLLAALPADEVLQTLDEIDPFGVRRFEESLVGLESQQQHTLNMSAIESLFPCPKPTERITLPDQRDLTKVQDFHKGENFIVFQHLRKAGGTNFCSLAEKNLPKQAIPPYYCMPDMEWSQRKGAGYLHHWDNTNISQRMKASGYRIAGNEWDNFAHRHLDLPAVFCTSFRRPLDRALSQFRFECIEERGCKIKNITEWWEKRKDLYNVYTDTFADAKRAGLRKIFRDEEYGDERGEMMGIAMDTVAKFHLVLAMEWLGYAGPLVENVLGFHDLSDLTHRIRPHIGQHQRNDGQEVNKLGAAGIRRASWVGTDYLNEKQAKVMMKDLALDEILTDAARRIFLERLVCRDQVSK